MNKNRSMAKTTCSGLAMATATSIILSGFSPAAQVAASEMDAQTPDLVPEVVATGETSFAGALETTMKLHDQAMASAEKGNLETEPNVNGLMMANVSSTLNIRSTPSLAGDIVGKMKSNDVAKITSNEGDWIGVEIGSVKGYVSAQYAIVGEAIKARTDIFDKEFAVSKVSLLNVRSEASVNGDVLAILGKEQGLEIDNAAPTVAGWVCVKGQSIRGYVNAKQVDVRGFELSNMMSADEEREAVAKANPVQLYSGANVSYTESVAYNPEEEILLAALLMCEAGASFEGMLAVGGVVVNRLHAGYAPTLYDVIYQKGQFTPALNGKVRSTISSGVTDTAREAARQALAGVDITNGCKSFRAAWTGHAGINIGGNVFF